MKEEVKIREHQISFMTSKITQLQTENEELKLIKDAQSQQLIQLEHENREL